MIGMGYCGSCLARTDAGAWPEADGYGGDLRLARNRLTGPQRQTRHQQVTGKETFREISSASRYFYLAPLADVWQRRAGKRLDIVRRGSQISSPIELSIPRKGIRR